MRRFAQSLMAAASAAALFTLSVPAAAAASPSPIVAEALDPGDYVWQPERAADGEIEIVVSIPAQLAYVYRGGTLIGVSTVSTGRAGYDTPTGSFNILQKRREHYSNLYDNAPMPFMQRLTWDGIALHAGAIPDEPASHGCIRLPRAFAQRLFAATEVGGSVHVIADAPATPELALAMARGGGGEYLGMGGPDPELEGAY